MLQQVWSPQYLPYHALGHLREQQAVLRAGVFDLLVLLYVRLTDVSEYTIT